MRPVRAGFFFCADTQTDTQADVKNLIVAFLNFLKALKNRNK